MTTKEKLRAEGLAAFDRRSGSLIERAVFNNRLLVLLVCGLLTLFLGYQITKLKVNASFDKMIPQSHEYILNFFESRDRLGGLGNSVRIVVENPSGDIFDQEFLQITKDVNDALFLTPGVDRAWMKSVWMSSVRWTEVTEEGFRGGPVMPEGYDPETLRKNILTAGIVGSLVGNDFKSIMYVVPLLESDPATGQKLDYAELSKNLENIRAQYGASGKANIYIIGFAKLVGDLIDGMIQVLSYFAIAALVAGALLYYYTRCVRSTLMVLVCSIAAVIWLLGCMQLLGLELDPYTMLVPFLVFAVGVSHGSQMMNGTLQSLGQGVHKYVAARTTFRRLIVAGMAAIVSDAVGFFVLLAVDIPVIGDLAVTASMGMAVLIFTNLVLLPVLFSFTGVSRKAADRALVMETKENDPKTMGALWRGIGWFATRKGAYTGIGLMIALLAVGLIGRQGLAIGDLDKGAPELHPDSRYNLDVAYINGHYGQSSDQFVVIVTTDDDMCSDYQVLKETERLTWMLRDVPGVQSAMAMSDNVRNLVSGLQEGNPKWQSISRNAALLGTASQWTLTDTPDLVDPACSTIPVYAYLSDHKAETLNGVVAAVEKFAAEHNSDRVQFKLAAGPAGIEAVTNIVVEKANFQMQLYVYSAVAVICLLSFLSWRAVLVALIPLGLTSVLGEALMAQLGIGVKVATLPVVALGVGIGVDYALYLLTALRTYQKEGLPLVEAYRRAIASTGRVVALVGVTLAVGVVTWAWSPIKFQADMGIMLTFMFLWNMLGALLLVPALSYFLLNPKSREGAAQGASVTAGSRAPAAQKA